MVPRSRTRRGDGVRPRQLGRICLSLVPVFRPIRPDGHGLRNGREHRGRRVIHLAGWLVVQYQARAMEGGPLWPLAR